MNEVMPVNNHIQRNLLEIGQLRKVKYHFLLFQAHDLKLASRQMSSASLIENIV